MRADYGQFCGAARALDVVGDRWTLLVIRELGFGDRRFTDLLGGLPGISKALLARRLRDLERDGVIGQADLPPPAARRVYRLTPEGRDLFYAIRPLVAWGARRLGERRPGEAFQPHWGALAMEAFADLSAAAGVRERYQYLVGHTSFFFEVDDGSVELHDGRTDDPAVTVTVDEDTWARIAAGEITAGEAARAGRLLLDGSAAAQARARRIFSRKHLFAGVDRTFGSPGGDAVRSGSPETLTVGNPDEQSATHTTLASTPDSSGRRRLHPGP